METISCLIKFSIYSFIYISLDSWFPILFNGLYIVTSTIYFDIQVEPDLASGSPFRLSSVCFWHVPNIFWELFNFQMHKMFQPWNQAFSKEPWFLLMKNGIRESSMCRGWGTSMFGTSQQQQGGLWLEWAGSTVVGSDDGGLHGR